MPSMNLMAVFRLVFCTWRSNNLGSKLVEGTRPVDVIDASRYSHWCDRLSLYRNDLHAPSEMGKCSVSIFGGIVRGWFGV
jgi:hypothetical protein